MAKKTAFLLSATFLFLGVIIGFLVSPVKYGVAIGNNSGNYGFPWKFQHKKNECCCEEEE